MRMIYESSLAEPELIALFTINWVALLDVLTHAEIVRAEVGSRLASSAMLTKSLVPSKSSAPPTFPVVHSVPLMLVKVPVFPLPLESAAVVPEVSLKV
jgi:hypothetical protein